jgi:hypothetical protein
VVARGDDHQGAAADAAEVLRLLNLADQAQALFLGLDVVNGLGFGLPVPPFAHAILGGDADHLPHHAGRHIGGDRKLVGEDAGEGGCATSHTAERVQAADCLERASEVVGDPGHARKARTWPSALYRLYKLSRTGFFFANRLTRWLSPRGVIAQ